MSLNLEIAAAPTVRPCAATEPGHSVDKRALTWAAVQEDKQKFLFILIYFIMTLYILV